MRYLLNATIPLALACAVLQGTDARAAEKAQVAMAGTQGHSVFGLLDVSATAEGVHITGTLRGFSPSTRHGFHVHEKGDCSAKDASSAGAHFDPGHRAHGDPGKTPHHAGDLPNLDADAKGVAVVDMTIKGVTLDAGPTGILNRALVVHARVDDYASQPAGNSGDRIACGVITAGK